MLCSYGSAILRASEYVLQKLFYRAVVAAVHTGGLYTAANYKHTSHINKYHNYMRKVVTVHTSM